MSSPCSDGDSPPLSPSSPTSGGSSRRRKGVLDTRRAEQNRAAQRAFRQRKERYVKELETKVRDLQEIQSRANKLEEENERLRERIWELEQQQNRAEGPRGPSHPNQQPPTQRTTATTAVPQSDQQQQQQQPPLSPTSPSSHYHHHHHQQHSSSLPSITPPSQSALSRTLPPPPTFPNTRETGPMRLSDNRHPLTTSDRSLLAQGTMARPDPSLPGAENGRVLDDLITILRNHHRPPIPAHINDPPVES